MVSAVFQWAVRGELVQGNPVRKVESYCESGRERETYLTAEEARALIMSAELGFRRLLMGALQTGARLGELLQLRWKDVDFGRNEVVVQAAYSKTKRFRVIPLFEELQAELLTLREARKTCGADGSDLVFASDDGEPLGMGRIRGMLARALNRCRDIPEHKKNKITFYTFRHTFASLAAQNGVSYFELGKILGHSTPAMTARYAHFYAEHTRAAIVTVGRILSIRTPRPPSRKSGS